MAIFFVEASKDYVMRLADDLGLVAEEGSGEEYSDQMSDQMVVYQPRTVSAPVRVVAPAQDPAEVMSALRREAQELAELMQELNEIIEQNAEKQRAGFEELSDEMADLAKDVISANGRKDRVEEVSLLMDARA